MRTALLVTLAAAAVAAATPAFAAPTHQFVADGQSYTYTAHRDAKGVVTLHGQAGDDDFALQVRGNRVDGQVGYAPVSFTIPKETVARLDAEVPVQTAALAPADTVAAAN